MSRTIFSTLSGALRKAAIFADFLFNASASSSVKPLISFNSTKALSNSDLSTCTSISRGSKCNGNVASSLIESWKVYRLI